MADSDASPAPAAAPAGPSLGSWAREVWRRKSVVVLTLVATVFCAMVVWTFAPKVYSASADVRVSSGNLSTGPQSSAEASTVLGTQVQVLESTALANDVAQRLGERVEVTGVEVEAIPESQVATVTVHAHSAEGAAAAANAYVVAYQERRDAAVVEEATRRSEALQAEVDALDEQLAELQAEVDAETTRVNLIQARITVARDNAARAGVALGPEDVVLPNTSTLSALQARYADTASQLSALRTQLLNYQLAKEAGDGGAAIISAASPPAGPTSSGPVTTGLLATLLGLALGTGLALLLALRDTRVHASDGVRRAVPAAPLLATVPSTGKKPVQCVAVGSLLLPSATSVLVETYREVVLSLAARRQAALQRVLVAGATDAEDRTAAAGALAVAMARQGLSVLLVDARQPDGDAAGGVRAGLSDVLLGEVSLGHCLVPVDVPAGSLRVLAAGRPVNAAEARVHEQGLLRLLTSLDQDVDVVVVQGGPVTDRGVTLTLVPVVDGVLVPVLVDATRWPQLQETVEKVPAVGGHLLGLVVHEKHVATSSVVPATRPAANGRRARATDAPAAGQPATDAPVIPDADRNVSTSSRA